MIRVTADIVLAESELEFRFLLASGPGGQNVNKVATHAQLRVDVIESRSLPPSVKDRLKVIAGKRVNRNGVLVIRAARYRTQERNRADAISRLISLIRRAATPTLKRNSSTPTKASKERRLRSKLIQSRKKQLRGTRSTAEHGQPDYR